MNASTFRSYFPDLDEQLQALEVDFQRIWDQIQEIKAEEKSRVPSLSTQELVTYYKQKESY